MMDPTDLPRLVTELIFSFLAVEDLLNCSMVSSRWRDATNKNIIWQRHCQIPISFENRKCKVVPAFQVPTSDCDIPPPCKFRIHYMRQIHLQNNFRHNRCVECKLPTTVMGPDVVVKFMDNYVIFNDRHNSVFHLWDIQTSPVRMQYVPYLLDRADANTLQIVGDSILIVQWNLLQLYQIVNGFVTLKLCRVFDRDEKFSEVIPSYDAIAPWYASNFNINAHDFTSHCTTVGDYFTGLVEAPNLNESVIHIWNLKSGKKIIEERLPTLDTKIEFISCEKSSKFLYIAVKTLTSETKYLWKIFCYDPNTLQYTHLCVESKNYISSIYFGEKVIVLLHHNGQGSAKFSFLDAETGKGIWDMRISSVYDKTAEDLLGHLFVFCNSKMLTVTVVDVITQETKLVIPIEDSRSSQVNLLHNSILLLSNSRRNFVEVWDIKKKTMLYKLVGKSAWVHGRFPDTFKKIAKLVFKNDKYIQVLHYW